ncbi:MAG: TldD/PmbA family protein [Candidatus Micrarchaeota archaeon]
MPPSEIYNHRLLSARMVFSGGALKVKEADSEEGYGVRVLSDGRLGFSYCQQFLGLEKAIKEAEALARFSPKSGFSFAPPARFPEADVFDSALAEPDFGMLHAFLEDTRSAAESLGGKSRIITSIDSAEVGISNSGGLSGSYRKTVFSIFAECMHGDGFGYSYLVSHHPPPDLHELGLRAAEMAKAMQGAGKPDGGSYTVVMEQEALDSLIETLMPSLSGDWKRRKMTKLDKGMKLDPKLSIYEDPLSPPINARPFDDEGVPSRKTPLIENGDVKSFLYDRETAALEGVQESGACTRASFDSPPAISPSNTVIPPGDRKDLSDIGKFIEIHYAHGSHTANITSGDIGLEVSGAFLVEGGKRRPVKGFLLSGNVFDLFSNIEGIESRQKQYGSLLAPRMAFRDVKIVS